MKTEKIILCRDCGIEVTIYPPFKQILCKDCKEKSLKNHFKNTFVKKWLCRNLECNNVVYTQIKKGTKVKEFGRSAVWCDECKKSHLVERHTFCKVCAKCIKTELVDSFYPQYKERTLIKVCEECKQKIIIEKEQSKIKQKQEWEIYKQAVLLNKADKLEPPKQLKNKRIRTQEERIAAKNRGIEKFKKTWKKFTEDKERYNRYIEAMSSRMKENNPMKQKDVARRMGTTLSARYKSGEIKKVIGEEHWSYKGNRNFNLEVRKHLYNIWTFPILERDDFKCTKCGTHEKLQVHHIRPLREIIKFVFAKHNKVYKNARFNRENESEFQQLLEEVLNEHRLIDGITLCKTCHEEVDYFYRTIKGKKKRED